MTMNQSSPDSGQSMEDILASIRRIIAEGEQDAKGGTTAASAPAAEAKAPAKAEAPKNEVFELTQIVQDDGSIVNVGEAAPPKAPAVAEIKAEAKAKTEPTPAPSPAVESKPAAVETPAAKAPVAPAPSAPPPAAAMTAPATPSPSPVDTKVESAMAALSRLMDLSKPAPPDALAEEAPERSDSSLTVEDLVRDAVRPLLRQWLDANLPPLVERLVREAVDKIAKRAG